MSRVDLFRKIVRKFMIDATGKSLEQDKCGLYETSTTDSGFMSGEITEEIREDIDSTDIEFKETNQEEAKEELPVDRPEEMFVDSGVCLTDSFSKINIRGQNDLNNVPEKFPSTPVESTIKLGKQQDDIPWKIYYTQDADGDTHLHTAIEEGFVEVTLALIRAAPYPSLLDTANKYGQTPLHLAVESGQWNVVRWLVVAGAKPCPRGIEGNSPLHIAAIHNDWRCIQAIAQPVQQHEKDQLALSYQGHVCQPSDFDQWNYLGQTCVHVAAIHGHAEVLKHLVLFGADINAREGCMGYTALHYAVKQRDETLVQCLLECKNIDVDVLTYGGCDVLEVNKIVPLKMRTWLRNCGVPSPFSSEDEDGEFDSEDEMYESSLPFKGTLVNASA